MFSENFVVVRSLYPRVTPRAVSASVRIFVQAPVTEAERDYRDLLNEANLNFFHREYGIALQNYLALRAQILKQGYPELPNVGGVGGSLVFDPAKLDPRRFLTVSKKILLDTDPGDPIAINSAVNRRVLPGEFPVNQELAVFSGLGLDSQIASKAHVEGVLVNARRAVAADSIPAALRLYDEAQKLARQGSDLGRTAAILNESAAVRATYAKGAARKKELDRAAEEFREASELFARVGDDVAASSLKANLSAVAEARKARPEGRVTEGVPVAQTAAAFRVAGPQTWSSVASVIAATSLAPPADTRKVGLMTSTGAKQIALDANFEANVISSVYQTRTTATSLDLLAFREEIEVNFVTYLVHLFYFVLPIAIGDAYLAVGRYEDAIKSYREVLVYPFLNANIESAFVWMKLAKAWLLWGNALYRGGRPNDAKTKYEEIVRTNLNVPANGSLYQHASLKPMLTPVQEAVKEIRNQAHAAVNPRVAAIVIEAHMRLQGIAQNLNFLGLAPDYVPIFRFRYLQSVATYLAESAVQTERTFVSFRASAENQTIERMQMESAVEINRAALDVEKRRVEEMALEVQAAKQTREYAELRAEHGQDALDEWNDEGRELTSMNAALAWAGNAANDQDINYNGVKYDGSSHDFSGTVEEFFDTVGDKREWLNWEMQQNRLERQRDESAAEVGITKTREQQAKVRADIQKLNVDLAQKRYDASKEVLEFAESRTFTEDLWFQLASMLEDLARFYLDAAIYGAFLMERAYALEYDRELHRIRFDYGVAGPANLLGGDLLKADIASFTYDLLQNARKKSPIRHILSLREEFPAAFSRFTKTGVLRFRTDLELFDRRYRGTYRRKIKRVEVFVEGLVPLEGAVGTLTNEGVTSEWREGASGWVRAPRVSPVERMVMSSYQFRRDLTVFQPSEEMLELFENKGLQANWTLELPRSGNNIDYEAITDIKFAVYFDGEHSDALAEHVRTFYSDKGGRSMVLSSRFHYPDEYFRFDQDRAVTFTIDKSRFAFNHVELKITGITVRLLPRPGQPVAGLPLHVQRLSDGATIAATTNTKGAVTGAPGTMAPFTDWQNDSPVDAFTVRLGDGVNAGAIADVQLSISYSFKYRPDA